MLRRSVENVDSWSMRGGGLNLNGRMLLQFLGRFRGAE
jgi:hypothetical protein